MYTPEGKSTFQLCRAGEVQRFQRDALVSPLPVFHIEKTQETYPQCFARCRLPDEASFQRSGAHIQLPAEIAEGNLPQIQLLAVQSQLRHEPVRGRNHEMGLFHDAPVGAPDLFDIVNTVAIASAKAVHTAAFLEKASCTNAFICQ